MCHDVMNVQFVQYGIGILGNCRETSMEVVKKGKNLAQTCREDDDLINFAHFFKEVVHARALDYVHVVPVVLDFDGHNIIGLLNRLHGKVRHRNLSEREIWRTLKLLCTNVSSRSRTRHLRPT